MQLDRPLVKRVDQRVGGLRRMSDDGDAQGAGRSVPGSGRPATRDPMERRSQVRLSREVDDAVASGGVPVRQGECRQLHPALRGGREGKRRRREIESAAG